MVPKQQAKITNPMWLPKKKKKTYRRKPRYRKLNWSMIEEKCKSICEIYDALLHLRTVLSRPSQELKYFNACGMVKKKNKK